VQSELSNRGFKCSAGKSVVVLVNLNKFYSDFKMGVFSGSAAAEVTMNIQVKNSDGTISFSSLIAGEGTNPSLQIMSGANARIALEAALKDAVSKLMADNLFMNTLLNSANKARADANRRS